MDKRFDYVKYDAETEKQSLGFKLLFSTVTESIDQLGPGRAVSIALTKLEEAYMWVGKALRDQQIERNKEAVMQEERKDG